MRCFDGSWAVPWRIVCDHPYCIDPRLEALTPEILGISEDRFAWLQEASNILTIRTTSVVRSPALAAFVKDTCSIFLIGHTEGTIAKTNMLQLLLRM